MNTTLAEGIDWVGWVDWTVRDFHSYNAERGTTYNAYLIRDEETALIDAVKEDYGSQLLRNISSLTDLSKVDYVVCNHAEPDHTGALPEVLAALPNATLVCDKKCLAALSQHFDTSGWKCHVVSTGDTISLGKRTLQFVETPMVHWPESMFTYIPEDKLLFSMDAFGQHYATAQRFDDEAPLCTIMEEAKTYYANIVMPYGKRVAAALDRAADLDIALIAPSHGVIWRRHADKILSAYRDWMVWRPKPKVLIIYDTMWESTGRMARAILEGACMPGVEAKLIHVRRSNLTQIATEVLDAATLALGSPTLNRGVMPMVGAMQCYLDGLRPAGKAAFAFGSYGWSKGAAEALDEWIKAANWEVLCGPVKAQYRPTPEVLDLCRDAGRMLAEKALTMSDRKAGENICASP